MIAILKYNAGNITSVKNAVERLGFDCMVTDDAYELRSAEKVIFPGVGEASTAMKYLVERGLDETIKSLQQPVLGICLGLQLMCRHSEEGNVDCLGIFGADVKKFPPKGIIPHMGWNTLSETKSPIFNTMAQDDSVYFVHSFYAEKCPQTIAVCEYILPFSATMQKDNFFAMQFHPEKSGEAGEKLLMNFLKIVR